MALPHVGMLDTPTVRDVGLIFTERDYKGDSTFLIETRDKATCIPINVNKYGQPQGFRISSTQVCKPTTCVFFTAENCGGVGNFSVSCDGPGDVANHKSTDLYKSYICGDKLAGISGYVKSAKQLATMPHNGTASMF
ncbi:hypothetical protein N0V90_011152 [Kalmusia sp. IMI 367209]|nr:hypothetical protein N0V90_011152 [Kalmusia sp. IMI 367209]